MKIVVTSATPLEASPLREKIEKRAGAFPAFNQVLFHVSGVGMLQSGFSIQKMALDEKPDLILQIGIAGTFDRSIDPETCVLIGKEYLGSSGVLENGRWRDLFDLNLADPSGFPFREKALPNPWLPKLYTDSLPVVNSVTVDEITTDPDRMGILPSKYNAATESMEGASLHFVGLQYNIPFLQMRGISNYVGERNKQQWKIKEALGAVCQQAFDFLKNYLS